MIKNILVPLDGSTSAEIALPYDAMLAARCGANLFLLLAQDKEDDDTTSHAARSYLKEVELTIASYMAGLEDDMVAFKVHQLIATGEPAAQVLQAAYENQVDLIVMSTSGHHSPVRSLSVIEKIIQGGRTPVLLVNPHNRAGFNLTSALGQLKDFDLFGKPAVVALDGTLEAEIILGPAKMLAASIQTPLVLLRVTRSVAEMMESISPMISSDPTFWKDIDRAVLAEKKDALLYLQDLAAQDQFAGYPVTLTVTEGYPVNRIIGVSRRSGAGMVAMTSHLRQGFYKVVNPSATRFVIEESTLPVLVVKREAGHIEDVTATGN